MTAPPARSGASTPLILGAAVVVLGAAALLRLGGVAHLPVGLHVDEGFHLVTARAIASQDQRPVFVTGNYGNEPGFAYLSAIALTLIGPQAWAGRLVSAWAGILTVALTMRAAHTLFPEQRWLPVYSGAVLTGLYWHVHFSHYGSQPILAPLIASASIAALAQGWRAGSWRAASLAGLALGLGLYAYVVMRLWPLAVLVFAGVYMLSDRRHARRVAWQTALALGIAGLVASPLLVFFANNPGWFFNRANQITTVTAAAGETLIGGQVWHTLGGLFWAGDQDARYNLPGRPALDGLQIILFGAGCLALARRWRTPSAWWVVGWLTIGLVPSVLTEGAPQFGRTTLATPAVALWAALGLAELLEAARRHFAVGWRARLRPALAAGAAASVLVASAAQTAFDYFWRYAATPSTFATLNGDEWVVAQSLRESAPGTRLYGSPLQRDYYLDYATAGGRINREQFGEWDRGYWSIEYVLGPAAYQQFSGYNGRECVVLPGGSPARYVIRMNQGDRTPDLLAQMGVRPTGQVVNPFPGFGFEAYTLNGSEPLPIAIRQNLHWPGLVRLLSVDLPALPARPGQALVFRWWWQVEVQTDEPYKMFMHLLADVPQTSPIAQRDAEPCLNSYPTWSWKPDEIVVDTATLQLPSDLEAGTYALAIGWYQANGDGARRAVVDGAGNVLGDSVTIGHIEVQP